MFIAKSKSTYMYGIIKTGGLTYLYNRFHANDCIIVFIYLYIYILRWRTNDLYFYFPSLISDFVTYNIQKLSAKGRAEQKIFRGRSKALRNWILFKIMIFFALNHYCCDQFLSFECI